MEHSQPERKFRDAGLLLTTAVAAMAVHGYHPYVEDAEIYLPGIKKILNPSLYPQNDGFFASHAGMTLFPNLIAASVRLSHLPFDWALLLWQFGCVFLLLLGCLKIGRIVFRDPLAGWGSVALVASLLTLPVAGTALYIMDQYLNTRSISAATVLMMVACVAERRYGWSAFWGLFTACVHPLMAVFGMAFAITLAAVRLQPERVTEGLRTAEAAAAASASCLTILPLSLFPPVSGAYHEALQTRSYFFLQHWQWYEWLGLIGPFAIFWWFGRIARKRELPEFERICTALNIFGLVFALASLLTISPRLERFTLLQPMRYLHLAYILMLVLAGGLLAQFVLKRAVWRWLLLLVPLCAGMCYAQRELFPATPHVELPGTGSSNDWVQAFLWIRQNTPADALFALNPEHMVLDGEDQHGFRALAERSMLADNVKDSGAVTMFPKMAGIWKEQTIAQAGWTNFQKRDFERLKRIYGVTWVVLEKPVAVQFNCPYQNAKLLVCQVD